MAARTRTLPRYMVAREGRYWSRLVVPEGLRAYLDGKTELRTPLGGDYRQAVKAHHGTVAELQHRIAVAERAQARARGRPIEGRARYPLQPEALAAAHYWDRLAMDTALRDSDPRWARVSVNDLLVARLREGITGSLDDDELEDVIGPQLERFRVVGNVEAAKGSIEWRTAARALCVAEYEALGRVMERDVGDFDGAPTHPMLAKMEDEPDPLPPVSLRGLFRDYVKARAAVGRGRSIEARWAPVIESQVKHMKGDDARRITKGELLAWRNGLLEGGLGATTVSGVHLGAAKAILRWAAENDRLPANPAEGVRQAKAKKPRVREAGYTDAEALALLKAARAYVPKVGATKSTTEGVELTRAKRWVPWIAAFTGARVTELTQLRAQDFRQDGHGWVVRITPDAGSVKGGTFRDVPMHPQLVELGLTVMVEEVGDGPLFWKNALGRDPLKAARAVSGRLSDWIGDLEVAKGVQPNHAWRHRLKSQAMDLGVSQRVVDAIQGHAGRTASDGYGDVSLMAKRRAVEAFPAYNVA